MLETIWIVALLVLSLAITIGTIIHILLNNTRPAAMLGWAGVVLFAPFLGAIFYFAFGCRRVKRRAATLESYRTPEEMAKFHHALPDQVLPKQENIPDSLRLAASLTPYHAYTCDPLHPYLNTDDAYAAMLDSIHHAESQVDLSTYIFDPDYVGLAFVSALSNAINRGVNVRVIVDGIGALNQWTRIGTIYPHLKKHNIPYQRFLPPKLIPPNLSINLRNHRKLLIIDQSIVYTGGLNISQRYSPQHYDKPRGHNGRKKGFSAAVSDLHFRLSGQSALDCQHIFDCDWAFCQGHALPRYEQSTPQDPTANGDNWARVINDTPSDDFNRFAALFHSVVARAEHRVAIVTPYFIPSDSILDAFQTAALHGVDISIYLPHTLDQNLVEWARMHILGETLESGTKIYMRQGDFCHDKLLLVDDHYVFLGSPNWDPRSLMLNYEAGVECWCNELSQTMWQYIDHIEANSKRHTISDQNNIALLPRLKYGLAWMASSYL